MTATSYVLVTGATGQQGGGTARALLARGIRVRAFVRDPDSAPAAALLRLGAELFVGDLGDRAALEAAARGTDGVFSVQPSAGQPGSGLAIDDEARFGRNVADAARAAGVRHLVYTSLAGVFPDTGVDHFDSKWEIEQYVHALGVPFTIVRPATFCELLTWPQFYALPGVLSFFFPPEARVPLIAAEDIGALAAVVFASPDRYAGRTVELAGELLTGPEIAAAISHATGRSLRYAEFPEAALRDNPIFARIVAAVQRLRVDVDVAALRAMHPGLQTFATWLARGGAARIPSPPAP